MFGKLGVGELVLILVIVLIVFGAGKLPQIGGAIGKSLSAFRKAQKGEDEEVTPKEEVTTKKEAAKKIEG